MREGRARGVRLSLFVGAAHTGERNRRLRWAGHSHWVQPRTTSFGNYWMDPQPLTTSYTVTFCGPSWNLVIRGLSPAFCFKTTAMVGDSPLRLLEIAPVACEKWRASVRAYHARKH